MKKERVRRNMDYDNSGECPVNKEGLSGRKKSEELPPVSSAGKSEILDFLAELDSHLEEGLEWMELWGNANVNNGVDEDSDPENKGCSPGTDESGDADKTVEGEISAATDGSGEDDDSGQQDNADLRVAAEGEVKTDSVESELNDPEEVSIEKDAETGNLQVEEVRGSTDVREPEDSNSTDAIPELLINYRKRMLTSLQAVEGFRRGFEPHPEDWTEMTGQLLRGISSIARGELSIDFLKILLNGITHDRDVMVARTEGELAGRNALIEEKLVKNTVDDGLPALKSGSGAVISKPRPTSIFDLADLAR